MRSVPDEFDPADQILAGTTATAREAAEDEETLVRNPEDLRARLRLLGYYSEGADRASAERESHVLWLIAHAPDVEAIPWMSLLSGSQAYESARSIWLRHVSDPSASLAVVSNASFFFRSHEPETSEQILVDCAPRFAGDPRYWERRSAFYVGWLRTLDAGALRTRLLHLAFEACERHLSLQTSPDFIVAGTAARIAVELEAYERATAVAAELLKRGSLERVRWKRSNALHAAHTALGLVALRRVGDRASAIEHLVASVSVDGSPQLMVGYLSFDLAVDLQRHGETSAAIQFLSAAKELWTRGAERLQAVASALAAGSPEPLFALGAEHALLGPLATTRAHSPECPPSGTPGAHER